MKRSKGVKLLTLGIVMASIIGCEEEKKQEVSVFQSVEDCTNSNLLTKEQCLAAFSGAAAEHEKTAPKYNSRELCEQEYGAGQCQPRSSADGSSVFLPLMTGFMAARVLDDITDRNRDNYYGGSGGFTPQPLYRSSRDYSTYRTSNNTKVSTVGAKTATVKPSTVSTSVSKSGGFGNQSAARASWGGSSFGG